MEWVVNTTLRPLYPQEVAGTHWIGGWVGPRACPDEWGKSHPPPGFDRVIHEYKILRNKPCGINKQTKNAVRISCIVCVSQILHYKSIWLLQCSVALDFMCATLWLVRASCYSRFLILATLCKTEIPKWALQHPHPFSHTVNTVWTITC